MDTLVVKIPDTVMVALVVIAGGYGNGNDRKNRITADGYDYNKVQSCVNDLLPIVQKYR